MKRFKLNEDQCDLIFRMLFCSIFLGLGFEHLFSDTLIQHLMPDWVPYPRLISIFCGLVLVTGSFFILLGYRVRLGATILAIFLVVITVPTHLVGIFKYPVDLPLESRWMWDILQRTNLVKNLCLLGVCFRLFYYEPGKYRIKSFRDSDTTR